MSKVQTKKVYTGEDIAKADKILSFGRGKVILVKAGDHRYHDDGTVQWLIVDKAWTIRVWGTEHGLGQLSENGPSDKTILDAIPHGLAIPTAAVQGAWICTEKAAKAFLGPCAEADKALLRG